MAEELATWTVAVIVLLAIGCAPQVAQVPAGEREPSTRRPPMQVPPTPVVPQPGCRTVQIPPTPRLLEQKVPSSGWTLTDTQLSMVYALSEPMFWAVAMFGMQPLVLTPRPVSGRILRLWADPANGGARRMVELDGTSGHEEVRAYAWFHEGSEASMTGECGEIVCGTVHEGPCGSIACMDAQPGEVYRDSWQLRGCDVPLPDCLAWLLQPVAPPRQPPPNRGWTHGYTVWIEHLDREQYWIGEYEDYFPKPRMEEKQFIRLLSGTQECPGAPPE
jgi:hypothetical protein